MSGINHNGIKNSTDQSETVQSGDAVKADSVYVRDAEAIFGILGEITESIGNSKSLSTRTILHNGLVIALTIICATFAVSALISSMQGFEKLFSS